MTELLGTIPEILKAASTGHWAVLALIIVLIFALAWRLFPPDTAPGLKLVVLVFVCLIPTAGWMYAVSSGSAGNTSRTPQAELPKIPGTADSVSRATPKGPSPGLPTSIPAASMLKKREAKFMPHSLDRHADSIQDRLVGKWSRIKVVATYNATPSEPKIQTWNPRIIIYELYKNGQWVEQYAQTDGNSWQTMFSGTYEFINDTTLRCTTTASSLDSTKSLVGFQTEYKIFLSGDRLLLTSRIITPDGADIGKQVLTFVRVK